MPKNLAGDTDTAEEETAKPIQLTATFDVFGDSLSDSQMPNNQITWARQLAKQLGNTVQGSGSGGATSSQVLHLQIYNNAFGNRPFSSANSAAIFMGTNDLNNLDGMVTLNTDTITEQLTAIATTSMLFCALPAASKFNARNSILTGTWANNPSYTIVGTGSNTAESTIEQTVTGRYVSFTISSTNPGNVSTYQGESFNWTITNAIINFSETVGTISNLTNPIWFGPYKTSPRITNGILMRTYIFDTGVVGAHTITITVVGGTNPINVDWFGGWEDDVQGNTTIVLGVPQSQYTRTIDQYGSVFRTNDIRREAYNTQLKKSCDTLRNYFKLPTYYIDTGATPCGHTSYDGLHLNFTGQKYLGNVVFKALRAGVQ